MADATPKQVELERDEIDKLKQRLNEANLPQEDKALLADCLDYNLWINNTILKYKMTINKLRRILFGSKSEKQAKNKSNNNGSAKDGKSTNEKVSSQNSSSSSRQKNISSNSTKKTSLKRGRLSAKHHSGCGAFSVTGWRLLSTSVRRQTLWVEAWGSNTCAWSINGACYPL